jgi:hypothetical protein
VVGPLEHEWIEYVEVLASTKDEAHDEAEVLMTRKGFVMESITIMPRPEKKVDAKDATPKALPPPAAAAPVRPTTPTQVWSGKPVEPEFETRFFTKYKDTPSVPKTEYV